MRVARRLNLASCGFSTWEPDIGGYDGWPDPEVYIRCSEWFAFWPLMPIHGNTPWEFGEEAVRVYKQYAWLRENLLDYIYASAETAVNLGYSANAAAAVGKPRSICANALRW